MKQQQQQQNHTIILQVIINEQKRYEISYNFIRTENMYVNRDTKMHLLFRGKLDPFVNNANLGAIAHTSNGT